MEFNNNKWPSQNGNCSNCGKFGHFSYQCNYPTVSYGLILYRPRINNTDNGVIQNEYLMLCRKDSFGYVDFIRGKYSLNDPEHIRDIFSEMSEAEHEKIRQATDFKELWCDLWNIEITKTSHKHEERMSRKKYEALRSGIPYNNPSSSSSMLTLKSLLETTSSFPAAEWEFPKGRKELNETEIECGVREFEEETGISRRDVQLVENLMGFDENYVGTNSIAYKHRYFLAELLPTAEGYNDDTLLLGRFQKSEVRELRWMTLDECMREIRPYHLEKKRIVQNIDAILNLYQIM